MMGGLMLYRIGFCFALMFSSLGVYSAELTDPASIQDESGYFAEVNETGGYVTQKLHDGFWTFMQSKYDEKTCEELAQKNNRNARSVKGISTSHLGKRTIKLF